MHTLEQLQNGSLAGITRLGLSCGLTTFPRDIFALADSLEILDLSGNALSALPEDLARLHRLRVLFCSANQFTELPAVLGSCPQLTMVGFKSNRIDTVPAASLPPALRWLILTDNAVTALPAEIGRCTELQKLMLAGNRLRTLPEELAACTGLELLRIAANDLSSLPAWLLAMPQLAWLAYAGNPFGAADEADARSRAAPALVPWERLRLGQALGEGASGVIYQATLAPADGATAPAQEVAAKLFKGAITSDGLPGCELTACVSAGTHGNLIPVLGEVVDHPEGIHACVMALVDPGFLNLAGPPSLDSCTRDIYPDGKRFSLAALLRLAGGIAGAAAHLHGRGILHGDLYAHNILHTISGEALLGDFGAASFVARGDAHADALQRLEVRAFGLLLGELIERRDGGADAGTVVPGLTQLRDDCIQASNAQRPLFAEITRRISDFGYG